MAHPNVDRYRAVMEAMDLEGLRTMLDDDVRWHEAGDDRILEGADAVIERFGRLTNAASPDITFDALLADDEHLVVVGSNHMSVGDQVLDYRFVEYYTLRDGKVTERWSFMDAVPDDVKTAFPS